MPRRNRPVKRVVAPDPVYQSEAIAKFVNVVMSRGKRSTAEKVAVQHLEVEQLEAALEQLLLGERITDLNGGALALVGFAELGAGEHRGPTDAVAAGECPQQHEHVPGARSGTTNQPLVRSEPKAHRVDQTVVCVRFVEHRLAADRRHAGAVAVVADAGDGAAKVPVGLAEPEPV